MAWVETSEGKVEPKRGFKLLGLSMSQCINDIILGNVREEDIIGIICGTRMTKSTQPMEGYWDVTWKEKAERAGKTKEDVEAIVSRMWKRMLQPRVTHSMIPNPYLQGAWIEIPADWYGR